MIEDKRIIIYLNPLEGLPKNSASPLLVEDFGQGMAARTAWRAALIERQALEVKPTLDAFYIWLQQPDQDSLLGQIKSLQPGSITPVVIASLNKSVDLETLTTELRRYPDIRSILEDKKIPIE